MSYCKFSTHPILGITENICLHQKELLITNIWRYIHYLRPFQRQSLIHRLCIIPYLPKSLLQLLSTPFSLFNLSFCPTIFLALTVKRKILEISLPDRISQRRITQKPVHYHRPSYQKKKKKAWPIEHDLTFFSPHISWLMTWKVITCVWWGSEKQKKKILFWRKK